MPALALGACAHGLEVGAAAGLGKGDAGAQRSARKTGQQTPLLFVGAEALDCGRRDEVRVEQAAERHPHRCHALDNARVHACRETEPAVLGRNGRAIEAERGDPVGELARVFVRRLEGAHVRPHLALQETLDRIDEQTVLPLVLVGRDSHRLSCQRAAARLGTRNARS